MDADDTLYLFSFVFYFAQEKKNVVSVFTPKSFQTPDDYVLRIPNAVSDVMHLRLQCHQYYFIFYYR